MKSSRHRIQVAVRSHSGSKRCIHALVSLLGTPSWRFNHVRKYSPSLSPLDSIIIPIVGLKDLKVRKGGRCQEISRYHRSFPNLSISVAQLPAARSPLSSSPTSSRKLERHSPCPPGTRLRSELDELVYPNAVWYPDFKSPQEVEEGKEENQE